MCFCQTIGRFEDPYCHKLSWYSLALLKIRPESSFSFRYKGKHHQQTLHSQLKSSTILVCCLAILHFNSQIWTLKFHETHRSWYSVFCRSVSVTRKGNKSLADPSWWGLEIWTSEAVLRWKLQLWGLITVLAIPARPFFHFNHLIQSSKHRINSRISRVIDTIPQGVKWGPSKAWVTTIRLWICCSWDARIVAMSWVLFLPSTGLVRVMNWFYLFGVETKLSLGYFHPLPGVSTVKYTFNCDLSSSRSPWYALICIGFSRTLTPRCSMQLLWP